MFLGKEVHVLPEPITLDYRAMTIIMTVVCSCCPEGEVLANPLGYECRAHVLCWPCGPLVSNDGFIPNLQGSDFDFMIYIYGQFTFSRARVPG